MMAPDVEELIRRVNTLTLDKNRLKQKLLQLTNEQNGKDAIMMLNQLMLQQQQTSQNSTESSTTNNNQSKGIPQQPTKTAAQLTTHPHNKSNMIAGVECATSSEDDLLYMNELFKKRLDEFQDNWDYIQSKCSALQSELTAFQTHHARLRREKLEMDEKYQKKCEECDDIKSELKTVALNYETQLSTMSEHLSTKINNCTEQF